MTQPLPAGQGDTIALLQRLAGSPPMRDPHLAGVRRRGHGVEAEAGGAAFLPRLHHARGAPPLLPARAGAEPPRRPRPVSRRGAGGAPGGRHARHRRAGRSPAGGGLGAAHGASPRGGFPRRHRRRRQPDPRPAGRRRRRRRRLPPGLAAAARRAPADARTSPGQRALRAAGRAAERRGAALAGCRTGRPGHARPVAGAARPRRVRPPRAWRSASGQSVPVAGPTGAVRRAGIRRDPGDHRSGLRPRLPADGPGPPRLPRRRQPGDEPLRRAHR